MSNKFEKTNKNNVVSINSQRQIKVNKINRKSISNKC